ncbi:uncharacterized protein [Panulirus ornatus]|uniref:uncharacterized protein n=1 Tax=Panulirus ornatus TaxID=150431 RepID=UPI003A87304D
MDTRTMNLSVLCVLVSVLCGCVMAESGGPAAAQTNTAAAQTNTATAVEEDPAREKRFYVYSPTDGRLHYALPVSGHVGVDHPPNFFSATQPVGFAQPPTSFPDPQPFPQTPSLRTQNSPNNFSPRYRSNRPHTGVSFEELADYVNYQQRQHENQYYRQAKWNRNQPQYPDVIDTKNNYFP